LDEMTTTTVVVVFPSSSQNTIRWRRCAVLHNRYEIPRKCVPLLLLATVSVVVIRIRTDESYQ